MLLSLSYLLLLLLLLPTAGSVCFYVAITLVDPKFDQLGYTFYIIFALILSVTRNACRTMYGISGNMCEDVFASLFLYPQVIMQCLEQVKNGGDKVD